VVIVIGALGLTCARTESLTYARVSTQSEEPDPPVHFHPHPDIPPDELGDDADARPVAVEDAGLGCPPRKDPPAPPKPKLRIASGPPVTNYIPPMVIMRPVRKRIGCLRQCFESGLAREPHLSGRVVFHFVVESDGWVRNVKVRESELHAPDVEECMRKELIGLEYPEPHDRISVVYPIVFQPKD
jgi:hypothetical protein